MEAASEQLESALTSINNDQLIDNLQKLGDSLRDEGNRRCTELSPAMAHLADSLSQMDAKCQLAALRVLTNYVADDTNRVYFAEKYNGAGFIDLLLQIIANPNADIMLRGYASAFLMNFSLGGDEGHPEGAKYLDNLSFADGTVWSRLLEALDGPNCPNKLAVNIISVLDELADIDDDPEGEPKFPSADLVLLFDTYAKQAQSEPEDSDLTLSVLEKITRTKRIDLNNDQTLVIRIISVLGAEPDATSTGLLFHSAMNLSANITNKNDRLDDYLAGFTERPIQNALIYIVLANYIGSEETKQTLVDKHATIGRFHQFFNDYHQITLDTAYKHLELQASVFAGKLITHPTILSAFTADELNSYLTDLKITMGEFRFQQVFKRIVELNLKFIQRLIISYQQNKVELPKDQYDQIVTFISPTPEETDLARNIDLIRFALINLIVVTGQYGSELKGLVDLTFIHDHLNTGGPVPFEYLFEETKTVGLVLSKEPSVIDTEWFGKFFESVDQVVKQNPNPMLLNNYKYLEGMILKHNSPEAKALASRLSITSM